jgi:hypothetical protein
MFERMSSGNFSPAKHVLSEIEGTPRAQRKVILILYFSGLGVLCFPSALLRTCFAGFILC